MNKITKTFLPYLVIIVLVIGCIGINVNASALSDNILDRVAEKIASILLADLENEASIVKTPIEADEAILGWSTKDEIHLNSDSGVIYLGKDKDVGIRISSGVLQCNNTTSGTWGSCAGGTPGDEGWLADGTNNHMYPATNAGGDLYPLILGETSTSSPANYTTELYVGGGGGLVVEGEFDVAGAVEIDGGALTFNDASANDLDVRMESATDANCFMLDGSVNKIGIGVSDPGAKLEVYSATAQLWLSYDGSNAATFTVDSGGDLTIAPSGADMAITGDLTVSATTTMAGLIVDTDTLIVNAVTEKVGINVADPDYALEILHTSTPLKLSYDGTKYATFVISSGGDLTITAQGGDISMGSANLLTTGNIGGANITASGDLTAGGSLYVINSGDNVGIASSTPFWRLSVVDTASQLALAYDNNGYVLFDVDASDDLTITASGGEINFGDENVSTTGTFGAAATTLSSTLAVTGASTFTGTLTANGSVLVGIGGALDAATATALSIGTSTATSIEISDTGITTNVQGPLTAAETVVVTGTLGVTGVTTLVNASSTLLSVSGKSWLAGEVTMLEGTTAVTATTTLTAVAHGGHTIYIAPADQTTITLPAATDGLVLNFVITGLFTEDVIIDSAEGDNIEGALIVAGAVVDCDAEDQINFIDDGENLGDYVELRSDGTKWYIGDSGGLTASKLTCTDPT